MSSASCDSAASAQPNRRPCASDRFARVAVLGNLAGVGYRFARALRTAGIEADLYFGWEGPGADPSRETGAALPPWCNKIGPLWAQGERPRGASILRACASIAYRSALRRLAADLAGYDVVQSVDGWNFFPPRAHRPYATFACGADLAEVAYEDSARGRAMLEGFRGSDVVMFGNVCQLPYLDDLGLTRNRFVPYAIDASAYPMGSEPTGRRGPLVVFAPAHVSWDHAGKPGRRDGLGRSRGKGNDRLLRAVRHVLDAGRELRLVMVEHGPDVTSTKRLARDLGLAEAVSFVPPMGRRELTEWYGRADIVADQFELGSFGLITLEAMACGRPVLVGMNDDWARRCDCTDMPVLSASNAEGIAARIIAASDPAARRELGLASRHYIESRHSPGLAAQVLIEEYGRMSGGDPAWVAHA